MLMTQATIVYKSIHGIMRSNLDRSRVYVTVIEGTGERKCLVETKAGSLAVLIF